jgi:ribosomal protein L37AE/L43A
MPGMEIAHLASFAFFVLGIGAIAWALKNLKYDRPYGYRSQTNGPVYAPPPAQVYGCSFCRNLKNQARIRQSIFCPKCGCTIRASHLKNVSVPVLTFRVYRRSA